MSTVDEERLTQVRPEWTTGWIGDVQFLEDAQSLTPIVTLPANDIRVTAVFSDASASTRFSDWADRYNLACVVFRNAGLRVALDRPYAGTMVPLPFYRRNPGLHSLMIEVNRGLYLHEETAEPLSHYPSFRRQLQDCLAHLVDGWKMLNRNGRFHVEENPEIE